MGEKVLVSLVANPKFLDTAQISMYHPPKIGEADITASKKPVCPRATGFLVAVAQVPHCLTQF